MKRILLALLPLFALPSPAQVTAPETLTIPAGTAIRIRTTQPVSSDTARVGDDVAMEVLADVAVDKYVVIRQGSPVIAVVSVAKEAKRHKSAICRRATSAKAGDTNIRSTGH